MVVGREGLEMEGGREERRKKKERKGDQVKGKEEGRVEEM